MPRGAWTCAAGVCWRMAWLMAMLLSLFSGAVEPAAGGNSGSRRPGHKRMSPADAEAFCAPYAPLWSEVPNELSRWHHHGISLELVAASIKKHTTRDRNGKGFAGGFRNKTAQLLEKPDLRRAGHHASLIFAYMQLLLHLQDTFEMPDLDLVISTVDRPLVLYPNPSSSDQPVFRFCKTDSHADILIPIQHFHTKRYDTLLAKADQIDKENPWMSRKGKVFGRFSGYSRHASPDDPASPKREGTGGADICAKSSRKTNVCEVRTHFAEWCAAHSDSFDVRLDGFVPMEHHAKFKYLVHLDGQGLSSRFDQLLVMKSMVMKEESGYRGFYHHLLKPYKHYVPFWKQRPDDALEVVEWANSHDADAARIAAAGQELAKKYLNGNARTCYWYHLLLAYSKLLRYTPGSGQGLTLLRDGMPVSEYLDTVADKYEGGKHRGQLKKWTP